MAASKKFFDDITCYWMERKNSGLAAIRFADSVAISASSCAPELDSFDADLAKAPRVVFAADLATPLASPEKPHLYYKCSALDNCYQFLPVNAD